MFYKEILILFFSFLLLLNVSKSFSKDRIFIDNEGGGVNIKVYQLEHKYNKHTKHNYKNNKKQKVYHKAYHNNKSSIFIAKKRGKIFHKKSCKFAKRIKHKIYIKTRRRALKLGLRPCKHCKP